jgi:hypothetical protein
MPEKIRQVLVPQDWCGLRHPLGKEMSDRSAVHRMTSAAKQPNTCSGTDNIS